MLKLCIYPWNNFVIPFYTIIICSHPLCRTSFTHGYSSSLYFFLYSNYVSRLCIRVFHIFYFFYLFFFFCLFPVWSWFLYVVVSFTYGVRSLSDLFSSPPLCLWYTKFFLLLVGPLFFSVVVCIWVKISTKWMIILKFLWYRCHLLNFFVDGGQVQCLISEYCFWIGSLWRDTCGLSQKAV